MDVSSQDFFIKNCSLATLATGVRASSLSELRDRLLTVDENCIYHHFWGERMNPQFVHTQHHNDFAAWIFHRLHDHALAERLSVIDPTEFDTLEALRQELIETVEKRLDETEVIHYTKKDGQFHFLRSILIVFESTQIISHPDQLPEIFPKLSPSSIFYHFIDARARIPEKIDDFSSWLKTFGESYQPLIDEIRTVDPYFLSLTKLREELTHIVNKFFQGKS